MKAPLRVPSLVLAMIAALAPLASGQAPGPERVNLLAGRSIVLGTPFDVSRIAVTNPAVADATVVQPREILIDGKAPGSVSLIVWGSDRRVEYELVVDPGVSPLQQQLQAIFPGEDVNASQTPESVILTGHASNNNVMLRAGEIAAAMAPKAKVLNMLQLPGGSGSQQVMLQVRVAEVTRGAVRELGVSMFTGATGYKDWMGRSTTQQFAAPGYDNLKRTESNGAVSLEGETTFSDFLNLFVFNTKYNVGALIRALRQRGFIQTLAEPNLIAYNGQEASFLAGGEIPVPVVSGIANNVSIEWKEFGVRLKFTPTVAGDVLRIKIKPEVSTLDFTNGVTLSGFRIPALITRRAETDVELRDGQTFAIAGLLNNLSQESRSGIPVLADLPIIGNLFKSSATKAERTELMVLVTPRLVRPLNADEVPPLPTDPGRFLGEGDDILSRPKGDALMDAPAPVPDDKNTPKTKSK